MASSKQCNPDVSSDELFQCSICMETLADPRALPCLHSYCLKCISNWCSAKKPGSQADCPLCRQEFTIPTDGIEILPKNFFIQNLLNLNQLKGPEAKVKLCEMCDVEEDFKQTDKVAEMFCLDCQQRMCKSCSTYHSKMKITISHKVVSLDEISSDSADYSKYQSIFCDKHTDKKIEVFCFVCKTVLCMMCYIKDHNTHKCSDVAEVAGNLRISLNQVIQHLTMSLQQYETNLVNIQQNGVKFCEKAKKVESEICTRADQLHAEIDTAKQKLIDSLNATLVNRQKEIANVTEEISQNKSILQKSLNYCVELLQKGADVDIAREVSGLHTRAKKLGKVKSVAVSLRDVRVVDVSFSKSVLTYSYPDNVLGLVTKKGVEPTLLATTEVKNVTAIALLENELFVCQGNVRDVTVYESVSLKMKHRIPFKELVSPPTGLATCSTNKCLYVSDFSNRRVLKVDDTRTITSWKVSSYPGQLAVKGSDHNVLVAYERGDGLGEYSPTGTFVRTLLTTVSIFQAIELNTNTVAVSQWQPTSRLCTITKKGSVQLEFKVIPDGDKCGLAADSYGNIVFCDKRNNRLQVVNSSLTSVHTLPLPDGVDLQSPNVLCYDAKQKRLFVGEDRGNQADSHNREKVFHSTKSAGFRLMVFDVNDFN